MLQYNYHILTDLGLQQTCIFQCVLGHLEYHTPVHRRCHIQCHLQPLQPGHSTIYVSQTQCTNNARWVTHSKETDTDTTSVVRNLVHPVQLIHDACVD